MQQVKPNTVDEHSVEQSGSEVEVSKPQNEVDKEGESILNREGKLAYELNRFRFKNGKLVKKLLELFSQEGTVVQSQSGKELKVPTPELLERMRVYFREIEETNQILPDFTFSNNENKEFITNFEKQVLSTKMLQDNSSALLKLQSQAHYSYYLSDAQINNYEELIIRILVEEFILLNSQSRSNESLTLDFSHSPEHLGLLDQLYNKVFLLIHDKNNENNTFDVFILLTYDDNLQGIADPNSPQIKNLSKQFQSLSAAPQTQSYKSQRFNQAVVPQKYLKLLHRSTQIPKNSVKALVRQMDQDKDNRVTVEDIIAFSHSKFIFLKPNIYQEMFDDVAKLRSIKFPEQKQIPITVDEIWAAAQMHYKLGPKHTWEEFPRPYRKYWIQLLQEAGEQLPLHHDLPVLKIEAVRDQHQFSNKFQPTTNNSQLTSNVDIQDIPKKQYIRAFRPEAGIVVNNTEYIQEVVQDEKEQMRYMKDPEAFEKVVNIKLKHSDKGECSTIKFDTKNYFTEADRLSKNPRSYKHSSKNPIYTFVPENFNFQMNASSGQEFFSNDLKKGKHSLRFSQGANSNFVLPLNKEQDSISQFREDDPEEYDIESLMKTQSIRLSTQRIPIRTPQQKSQQNPNRASLPQLNPPKFQHSNHNKKGYPFNVFNPAFYDRKYTIKPVVTAEEKDLQDKNIFVTTFKLQDCPTLKSKLFNEEKKRQEDKADPFQPANKNIVRESYPLENKETYITRFKCDPLKNPNGMSDHDSRPIEALVRDEKLKKKKQEEEQKLIDDCLGKPKQEKDWKNYFKLADMDHNFVDEQRPNFLDKGKYVSPSTILGNLLRENIEPETHFKLFHRVLGACDKNMVLGEVPESKF